MVVAPVVNLIPVAVASPYASTVIDPLWLPVAFHVTVEPGAGLNDCVFRGVSETVAVVAQLVVGQVLEVI
jgi:hypothetical protein